MAFIAYRVLLLLRNYLLLVALSTIQSNFREKSPHRLAACLPSKPPF
jgi:hypothetical protein